MNIFEIILSLQNANLTIVLDLKYMKAPKYWYCSVSHEFMWGLNMSVKANQETLGFQTEVKQLLDLMLL